MKFDIRRFKSTEKLQTWLKFDPNIRHFFRMEASVVFFLILLGNKFLIKIFLCSIWDFYTFDKGMKLNIRRGRHYCFNIAKLVKPLF